MNTCKTCISSVGEFDPINFVALLYCNKKQTTVDPDGGCEKYEYEPGTED